MLEGLKLEEQFMLVITNASQSNKLHLQPSHLEVYTIGASMIDMLLEGLLKLNDKEEFEVNSLATETARQPLLDIMARAKRPKKMKDWVTYFINHSGQRKAVFGALIAPLQQSGLISQEEHKILWFFPVNRLSADTREKDRVIQGLRAELLEDGPVSLQTSVLAMLLEASKQLKHYFSDYERNEMLARLKRLQTEQSAEWKTIVQIKKAIEDIEAAGAIAATIASTTATS